MRRSRADIQEARGHALAEKDAIIARYRDGESMASLSRGYGVADTWLAQQFTAWGEPRRDRSAAARVRGPGVPPLPR